MSETGSGRVGRAGLAHAVRGACILEAWCRKPGNVTRERSFPDLDFAAFHASAEAIAPILAEAPDRTLGATILAAVRATRAVVATNTNLGIVLLLAPLCRSAIGPLGEWPGRVREALQASTIADSAAAYEAIRIAQPGGLGKAPEQDVAAAPSVTLAEAMELAADRDAIAREWATGFAGVFAMAEGMADDLRRGLDAESAVIAGQLRRMAEFPDTLIARKHGPDLARAAAEGAAEALANAGPGPLAEQPSVRVFDGWLRARRANPGATADLACAALFCAIQGGISAFAEAAGRALDDGPPTGTIVPEP